MLLVKHIHLSFLIALNEMWILTLCKFTPIAVSSLISRAASYQGLRHIKGCVISRAASYQGLRHIKGCVISRAASYQGLRHIKGWVRQTVNQDNLWPRYLSEGVHVGGDGGDLGLVEGANLLQLAGVGRPQLLAHTRLCNTQGGAFIRWVGFWVFMLSYSSSQSTYPAFPKGSKVLL